MRFTFTLVLALLLNVSATLYAGYKNNAQINEETKAELKPYLMTKQHPLKKSLNKFFKETRVIHDTKSLKAAGFINPVPQPKSGIIVTKHPKFKGYIFKIYCDAQEYYKGMKEHRIYLARAQGAEKIRHYIASHQLEHLFKVPKKWIYKLPKNPKAENGTLAKHFILVEEEMDLIRNSENIQKWRSLEIKKPLLTSLFQIVSDLKLRDCCKIDNIPFCLDGRIAFVDTQSHSLETPFYEMLLPALSEPMGVFWRSLW